MASLDSFLATYGTDPWTDITLRWSGTATEFRLYQVGNPTALYTGTLTDYDFTGLPDTRYDFRLEAELASVVSVSLITVFTRAIPAPLNLTADAVVEDGATLNWEPVSGATKYEVADVQDDYTIIDDPATETLDITGMATRTLASYAVRTVIGAAHSRWSAAVTFTTLPSATVTPGVYTFPPDAIACFGAGKAGSTSPAWLPATDDWYHGEGTVWGNNNGVLSTWFFFGAVNPFSILLGGTVTNCEIYLARASYGGDPAAVLSRWALHAHTAQPVGAPSENGTSTDVGSFARGDTGWVTLPNAWGTALIAGTVKGAVWGGVAERYQISQYTDATADPRVGTIRLTVS